MTRTIDNLGVGASTRYAVDQKSLEKAITRDASLIPPQTEMDVSIPSYLGEYDQLFDTDQQRKLWAEFAPPEGYMDQKKRLFTLSIIPALSSGEKIEAQVHRINSIVESTQEDEMKVSYDYSWERQREKAEEEKEQKILTAAMSKIKELNKQLTEINGFRKQFHKG